MRHCFRILATMAFYTSVAAAQEVVCGEAKVHYEPPSREIQAKIYLTSAPKGDELPKDLRKNLAPQRTRWFVEIDPDYTKTESLWNTTLYIGDAVNRPPLLRIDFTDHGNTFEARWINNKLLFIEVWWGRIASSDLILDVDQGKFIYNEFAHYGELGGPCRKQ